ncbi:MAG: EamA family transporter [Anaerolineales bacterium]|nr:EamA family transporter [Anaerolineales bacterium]
MYKASKTKVWAALIAVYIVWGSTYLAIRFGVETLPPFLMAATRFLVPGAFLYTWRRLQKDPPPTRLEWRSAALVGLFLLVGGNGALTWAEQRVPSGIAALLVGAAPIWMVIIDAARPNGRRPNRRTLIGILLGFAGIVLLVGPVGWNGNGQPIDPLGLAALLFCALVWAIGSLINRDAQLPASPLLGTGMEMLAGGAGLLLLGTLAGEWSRFDPGRVSTASLLGLGYLIVFGSAIGFAAYAWLLRVAPTPLVSTYAYVNPMIAIFVGNLLADEALTPRILLAALVIVSSVALINTARSQSPQAEQRAATVAGAPGDQ